MAPIAGKTGTCSENHTHLGWFGSFNDVGDRKLVVVVLLTGGTPAIGPLAAGIAGDVYRKSGREELLPHRAGHDARQPRIQPDLLHSIAMPVPVLLSDLVEALVASNENYLSFLDRETDEVKSVDRYLLNQAEVWQEGDPLPSLPEWQKPQWEDALRYFASAAVSPLPDKYDIHEWNVMRDFADSFPNERIAAKLQEAIHGKGAFRMFRSVVKEHELRDDRDEFSSFQALVETAMDWCLENKVEYRED